MDKERFEAFSDAVFAFAATLLILGIALPVGRVFNDEAALRGALLALWPSLIAYTLSFVVIGIVWQNHHALFRTVERIDRTAVMLNFVLLGITAFIPFATSTLGTYWWSHSATFLYGLTLTASATMFNLQMAHLLRERAFRANVSAEAVRQTAITYRGAWLTYGGATLVALLWPVVSFALYIAMAVFHLFPRGVDSDETAT